MSVTQKLVPGVLVWAKVEPYPWWPGRILKTIQQKGQQVFKIAFFADPTYTYLHSHQIIPFQQFDVRLNGQENQHPALQRAVKMAHSYLFKQNAILSHQESQQPSKRSTMPVLSSKVEEFEEQNSNIPSEKYSGLSPMEEVLSDPMALESHSTEVTVKNVIELLQREETSKKRQGYCYQQRKEHVRYQDKLKEALLKRYNLLNFAGKNKNICSQKPIIQITANTKSYLGQKKHKKINKSLLSRKSLLNDQIQYLSKRCMKKINSILKDSSDSSTNARFHSMQIMRRIIVLSDNNHLKFKSLFVTLVKTMSCSSKGLNCEERLYDFRQYLQRLEGEKGEDEDGSRITQIETSMN